LEQHFLPVAMKEFYLEQVVATRAADRQRRSRAPLGEMLRMPDATRERHLKLGRRAEELNPRRTSTATWLLTGVTMKNALCVVLLQILGLSAASVAAQHPPGLDKAPWNWTVPERVAALKDPAQRAARVREHYERQARPGREADLVGPTDVIDGNLHPELFFPTELMESLVRSAFVTLPSVYPTVVRRRTSDLFREEQEWVRFSEIAAPLAAALRKERVIAENSTGATASALSALGLQPEICAALSEALRKSRNSFGKERFERMLYEVVPQSRVVFVEGADFVEAKARKEEQCH
jgi:hypothetical protein